jgi:hypothetical protein
MRKKNDVQLEKPKPYFSVADRFKFITQFTHLISVGKIKSFILTGDGGIGKTHTVLEGLKAKGLKEETVTEPGQFVTVRGYSTAKSLYRTLFENNGKVLVFDDCDSIHKDPIGANILKAALGSEEKRIVHWGAEFAKDEELPNRFEFTGKIIFISNLHQNQFPQALLSRSMRVDLSLNTGEKMERIRQVFDSIQVELKEKAEVLNFIDNYAEVASDLNIRSALGILKLKQDIGKDWESIALYTFTS